MLTTDIDTRHLETLRLPNVEVRHHDVVSETLSRGRFDLAYTRLVLEHVHDPDRALRTWCRRQARRMGRHRGLRGAARRADGADGTSSASRKRPLAMRQVIAPAGADQRIGRSLARRLRCAASTT